MKQFDIALSFATEEQKLVEKVYQYLKAENINVFFAPSPEGQALLSGENQRKAFYRIFGVDSRYVALFVSMNYTKREVPMEEAQIAFARHAGGDCVIPVYLDGAQLPVEIFDPKATSYFRSSNPAVIAGHLAAKVKLQGVQPDAPEIVSNGCSMNVRGNTAGKQIFVQNFEGEIKL